ncbi:MAG: hypothetical protein B6241_10920 [Spirochaetaceae bacterium 4572_59]|nr:MAG: hypothetical protein B6241_10920 [Spirochaetaceae bacterium 4572_59]
MPLGPSGDIPIKEFQTVLAKLGVFLDNNETGERFINDIMTQFGYTEENMKNISWMDLVHPDDRENVKTEMERIRNNESDRFDQIYRIRTVEGDYRWIYNSGIFLSRDRDGNPALFLGADRDITTLKETEHKLSQALMAAEKKTFELETLQAAAKTVTSLMELEEAVDVILQQIKKVIPYKTASVQVLKDDELHIIGTKGWNSQELNEQKAIPLSSQSPNALVIKQKEAMFLQNLNNFELLESGHQGSSWIGVPLIINDKILGLLSCNGYATDDFNKEQLVLAEGFGDFMAIAIHNVQTHERVVQQTLTDPLTGINNRRCFYDNGEKLFFQAKRYNRPLSVLMIDLDNFKNVNDQYGHKTGDEVLVASSLVFKDTIRKSDQLYRYGGEEFCIILPETDQKTTQIIADRILERIRTIQLPDGKKNITVSIGITALDFEKDKSFEETMSRADKALYSAKNQDKDRWIIL